ncbi:sugar transferase [uncultured Polaribacter sp.]
MRQTSLDEASQVFTILKGDMSIIVPRSLLREYIEFYGKEQ